jgi:hypothetical protein
MEYPKKNSFVEMMKNPKNYTPAPAPGFTSECTLWDNGECLSLEKSTNVTANQGGKKIIPLVRPSNL